MNNVSLIDGHIDGVDNTEGFVDTMELAMDCGMEVSPEDYDQYEELIDGRDPRRNGSGCFDFTAYDAIRNVERERYEARERHRKLIGALFRICELADFSVEERIVVRDKRTGKVWR